MSFNKEQRDEIVAKYARKPGDTGCPEVQIALQTARIIYLTDHMKEHHKDFSSRRGLLNLVSKRRRLLDYLKSKDEDRYQAIIQSLKLRR